MVGARIARSSPIERRAKVSWSNARDVLRLWIPDCAAANVECMSDGDKKLDGDCKGKWERCGDAMAGTKKGWEKIPECAAAEKECMSGGEKTLDGSCKGKWEKCGDAMAGAKKSAGEKKSGLDCSAVLKKDCMGEGSDKYDCTVMQEKCESKLK